MTELSGGKQEGGMSVDEVLMYQDVECGVLDRWKSLCLVWVWC